MQNSKPKTDFAKTKKIQGFSDNETIEQSCINQLLLSLIPPLPGDTSYHAEYNWGRKMPNIIFSHACCK